MQATKKPHGYHKIAVWQKDDRIWKSPLKFYVYYYSELSGDYQVSIFTELWRLSVVFLCYFMAHEHLLKEHTYLHVASGDTPILEYRRLRSYISKLVTSRFFQKWCSSGVVSALLLQRTTDFTGFFRTFRDIAVTYKQDLCHFNDFPSVAGYRYCTTSGPRFHPKFAGGMERGAGQLTASTPPAPVSAVPLPPPRSPRPG